MTACRLMLLLCMALLLCSGRRVGWHGPYLALAQETQAWAEEESLHGDVADVQVFYEPLAPYGRWTTVAAYGQVWIPHDVPAGWRPYMEGRWVYTRHGWTWIAEQPWGWAPFHYGRWAFVTYYGWVWIPGTVWGPAWVVWRHTPGWVGWAPLPPHVTFQPGVGLYGGHDDWHLDPAWFCFVEERRLLAPRLVTYLVPPSRNVVLVPRTRNVTRYTVTQQRIINVSLPVERIERVTAQPVPRIRLARPYAPEGQPGVRFREKEREVVFYRPGVRPPPARLPGSSSQTASPLPATPSLPPTPGLPSVPAQPPPTSQPGHVRPPGGPTTPAEIPSQLPQHRPGGLSREDLRRRYEGEQGALEERPRRDRRGHELGPRPPLPGTTPQVPPQDSGARPPEQRQRSPREPHSNLPQLQHHPGVERQPLTRPPYVQPSVPASPRTVAPQDGVPHTRPRPHPGTPQAYPPRMAPQGSPLQSPQ